MNLIYRVLEFHRIKPQKLIRDKKNVHPTQREIF